MNEENKELLKKAIGDIRDEIYHNALDFFWRCFLAVCIGIIIIEIIIILASKIF
jgi:hypothetical protein